MVRHISIFTFLDKSADGKTKAENIKTVREYMERIPGIYPEITNQIIGANIGEAPPLPDGAPIIFGDLVQILDFKNKEDAEGYPPSKAHADLVELSGPMMKNVTGIDFVMGTSKNSIASSGEKFFRNSMCENSQNAEHI